MMPNGETQDLSVTDRVLAAAFDKLATMEDFDDATITRLRDLYGTGSFNRATQVKQALAATRGTDETP